MKKTFKVEDLDCAACAAKVENAVKAIDGVKSASVSYLMQKMTVETEEDADFDGVMKKAVKVCAKIEPEMSIKL